MTPERAALFEAFDAQVKAEAAAEAEWNQKTQESKDSGEAAAKLIADAAEAERVAQEAHAASVAATDKAYAALRGNG